MTWRQRGTAGAYGMAWPPCVYLQRGGTGACRRVASAGRANDQ